MMRASLFVLIFAASCTPKERAKEPIPVEPLSEQQKEALENLGYVTWDEIDEEERKQVGVITHLPGSAYKGLNYYCSENSETLQFVDMDGKLVHSISLEERPLGTARDRCKLVEFAGPDSILMLIQNHRIVSFDFSGKVRWQKRGKLHHDLDLYEDGRLITFRKASPKAHPRFKRPIRDELFVTLNDRGKTLERFSMVNMVLGVSPLLDKALGHQAKPPKTRSRTADPRDIFHANSIEIVRRTIRYTDELTFEEGDLLFCARHLDAIAVVDPKKRRIKWFWGTAELQWPHHASLLPDGNIMVFDNGVLKKRSRVLVLAPATGKIVWHYEGDPPTDFFSRSRGGAQQLPNGNVLITDSPHGRVFEVTRDGKTVWEFLNPDLRKDEAARATIYRMMRLTPKQVATFNWPAPAKQRLREAGYLNPN